MKIATIGTGGIGGYLAVKLSFSGHQIATIARGKHLEAIKKNGLSLKNGEDIETVQPWIATDDPKEVGKVDAIILGVKGDSLISAAERCFPLIDKDTVVVPFLNGVEATDRLISILPENHIANGLAQISTTIIEPGLIEQTGDFANFIFAERNNKPSPRIKALQSAINNSGSHAPETDDIERDVWEKFVMFSAMSGVTAAARCTIGDIVASDKLKALFINVMKETANAGRARGVNLKESIESEIWNRVSRLPSGMRASTAIDLEKGLPLEIDWVSGAASRLSRDVGLSAPLNETIYSLLSPYKNGSK